MSYRAPVADILFSMVHEVGIDLERKDGVYADLGDGLAEATLTEAGEIRRKCARTIESHWR